MLIYLEVNQYSFVVKTALRYGEGNNMANHTSNRITNNHPHTRTNGKEIPAKWCSKCQDLKVKRY